MVSLRLNSVLLVDDDKINNYINERLIKKLNFSESIKVVTNGQEAIEYLEGELSLDRPLPQLILLDINMPVMDGFEFIEAFKKIKYNQRVVIVVLTTSTNYKDIEKINNAEEVAGYINKPLTEQKLLEAIGKYF